MRDKACYVMKYLMEYSIWVLIADSVNNIIGR